jgi:hypothetical protein
MKQLLNILAATILLSVCANDALAQDKGGGKGKFVRLTEVTVGDREHLGIVVQPLERDAQITLVIPARPEGHAAELTAMARRLREGQIFEFGFTREGGQLWLRELGIPRGADAPDRPREDARRDQPDRPREEPKRDAAPRTHIERELAQLREENTRLRRQLEELRQGRPSDQVEAPRQDTPPTPRRDGELGGTFLRHTEVALGDNEFLAIVVKLADRDEPVTLIVPRRAADLMEIARQLKEGQRVEISWVEEEGKRWVRRIER